MTKDTEESREFPRLSGRHIGLALSLLVLIGLAARLAPWKEVFTPAGVVFHTDDDTYYHALRARRIIEDFPRFPWDDPNMNYPYGEHILWPPLFDALIAVSSVAAAGGRPGMGEVEATAAVLPVLLGIFMIPLAWCIGRVLLGRDDAALGAALLISLLPAHVNISLLGRPDQHVLEVLLAGLVILFYALAQRGGDAGRGNRFWSVPLGLALTLSFWNWMGSILYLLLLAFHAAAVRIFASADTPDAGRAAAALLEGTAAGSLALAISILLFGRPGALGMMEIAGINGFHLGLVLLILGFAAVLWAFGRLEKKGSSRWRRAGEVLLAAAFSAGLALAMPGGFGRAVFTGLSHLTAGNTWLDNITEFQPFLLGGRESLGEDLAAMADHFGAGLFVVPLAALILWRDARRRASLRAGLRLALSWGAVFFSLALLRRRMAPYLAAPMALWLGYAAARAADLIAVPSGRAGPGLRRGLAIAGTLALILLPAAPRLIHNGHPDPGPLRRQMTEALQWLARVPGAPGREAVMAPWGYGHLVQYYARKPVVTTPFGSSVEREAMEDAAAFFLAVNPEQAADVLRRRRVGFVILPNPRDELYNISGFAPPGTPEALRVTTHRLRGERVSMAPAFPGFVASRLFFYDGMGVAGAPQPALGNYRLLYESLRLRGNQRINDEQVMIFGAVPGALLTLQRRAPGTEVAASVQVRTNRGRVFLWRSRARCDATGKAELRLPYASGANGASTASLYRISVGGVDKTLGIGEEDVAGGRRVAFEPK